MIGKILSACSLEASLTQRIEHWSSKPEVRSSDEASASLFSTQVRTISRIRSENVACLDKTAGMLFLENLHSAN